MNNNENNNTVHTNNIIIPAEIKTEKKDNDKAKTKTLNLQELQKHLDNNERLFSYKQLCEILNDDYKKNSGNSKKNQIQYWSNFFDINHIGYKYEITEIYDVPLMNFYTNNRSDFYDISMYIILSLLLQQVDVLNPSNETASINITNSSLALQLGFINERYRKFFGKFDKLSKIITRHNNDPLYTYKDIDQGMPIDVVADNISDEFLGTNIISEKEIERFYNRTIKSYSSIINSVLNSMEKQFLILNEYIICGFNSENGGFRPLTDEEKDAFMLINTEAFEALKNNTYDIEHQIVEVSDRNLYDTKKDLNIDVDTGWGLPSSIPTKQVDNATSFTSISDLFKYGLVDDFYKIRNEKLKKEMGFDYICKAFHITLHKKCVDLHSFLAKKIDAMGFDKNISKKELQFINNSNYINNRLNRYEKFVNSNRYDKSLSVKQHAIDSNSKLIDFLLTWNDNTPKKIFP